MHCHHPHSSEEQIEPGVGKQLAQVTAGKGGQSLLTVHLPPATSALLFRMELPVPEGRDPGRPHLVRGEKEQEVIKHLLLPRHSPGSPNLHPQASVKVYARSHAEASGSRSV